MKKIPDFKFALTKKLVNNIEFLPSKAHSTDTGYDVRSAENIVLKPFEYALIPLGFRVLIPDGFWLELRPRSSSHAKKHMNCLYGVIDVLYENCVYFSTQYLPSENDPKELVINFGDKIGQLVPVERLDMNVNCVSNEELDFLFSERNGERKTGGFGSSG
jgi:dUTP pyrophosphatase